MTDRRAADLRAGRVLPVSTEEAAIAGNWPRGWQVMTKEESDDFEAGRLAEAQHVAILARWWNYRNRLSLVRENERVDNIIRSGGDQAVRLYREAVPK